MFSPPIWGLVRADQGLRYSTSRGERACTLMGRPVKVSIRSSPIVTQAQSNDNEISTHWCRLFPLARVCLFSHRSCRHLCLSLLLSFGVLFGMTKGWSCTTSRPLWAMVWIMRRDVSGFIRSSVRLDCGSCSHGIGWLGFIVWIVRKGKTWSHDARSRSFGK